VALNQPSEVRDVYGITNEEKLLIKAYLQGSVYSWVKNRKGEWFAARDLVGGENFEWQGTPLIVLYEKHVNKGKNSDEARGDAAKDLGWLLKAMLNDDKRHFEVGKSGLTAAYRWVGNEP
jgi:hypothetical protein